MLSKVPVAVGMSISVPQPVKPGANDMEPILLPAYMSERTFNASMIPEPSALISQPLPSMPSRKMEEPIFLSKMISPAASSLISLRRYLLSKSSRSSMSQVSKPVTWPKSSSNTDAIPFLFVLFILSCEEVSLWEIVYILLISDFISIPGPCAKEKSPPPPSPPLPEP